MMFTARMKYLTAVVSNKHTDEITKKLLSLGLLHFVNVTAFDAALEPKVRVVMPVVSTGHLADIRRKVESFLGIIDCHPREEKRLALESLRALDLEAVEDKLDDISSEVQMIRDRQKSIQQGILRFQEIKRQVRLLGDLRASIRASSHYFFLSLAAGAVTTERLADFKKDLEAFSAVVLVLHEGEPKTDILVISLKRDTVEIKALFNKHGFAEVQVAQEMLGVGEEVTATIDKKILILTAEQALLRDESRATIAKERDNLLALWENLKLNELYYKIQSSFSTTARTVLFSGWMPASKRAMIEEGISEVTRGRHFIEWRDPEGIEKAIHKKVKVPVQLKNLKILSPFQMLVTYYSTPEYGTIDPTPFVSVLYLIMFGIMFADVGQGLVLILIGLGARLFGRRLKAGMTQIMRLIIFCGAAAVIAGTLFGSYFGFPLFKPLWFDFHGIVAGHVPASSPVQSVLDVLGITLYFGIFVIALGLVFNWINLIRTRHWTQLIFDRTGIAGGALYCGGVYTGYYFVTHNYKALPDPLLLLLFVGVPALFLIGKPITEFIEKRHLDPRLRFTVFTPFFFIFQWMLELLEVFTGFLSNTLSFMRVAGMGIAHVALMMSFFEIARMMGTAGGYSVGSYIMLVVGNIFVIALEGLTAGIQSLRLNYYEFFSKFFRGAGEAYAPVSLKGS